MVLRLKSLALFITIILASLDVISQDQLFFKNNTNKFVHNIIEVTSDSITYKNFKKEYRISTAKLSGYYLTIKTKENLNKRFYKRSRTYHAIKVNTTPVSKAKLNPNKAYINRKLKTINKLDHKKFESGYFVKNGDTTRTNIYVHKTNSSDIHLYIITMDKQGLKKVYQANEIDYYRVANTSFKSYFYETKKIETHFFLKLIETGKVLLYECNRIPSQNDFCYYIQKSNEKFFYIVSPFSDSFELRSLSAPAPNDDYDKLLFKSNDDSEEFKKAIVNLLPDCTSIRNKVHSEFYSKSDLPSIIREYNACN